VVSLQHSGQDVVADLHAALRSAEVHGPRVLVDHSLGGAFVRLYAGTHPRELQVDLARLSGDGTLE
jgi:alpha-beta hydrolase superfamily lysophospholipase